MDIFAEIDHKTYIIYWAKKFSFLPEINVNSRFAFEMEKKVFVFFMVKKCYICVEMKFKFKETEKYTIKNFQNTLYGLQKVFDIKKYFQ